MKQRINCGTAYLCNCDRAWELQETKDIETAVAGIRADKVKAEAAEKAAKLKGAHVPQLGKARPHVS